MMPAWYAGPLAAPEIRIKSVNVSLKMEKRVKLYIFLTVIWTNCTPARTSASTKAGVGIDFERPESESETTKSHRSTPAMYNIIIIRNVAAPILPRSLIRTIKSYNANV